MPEMSLVMYGNVDCVARVSERALVGSVSMRAYYLRSPRPHKGGRFCIAFLASRGALFTMDAIRSQQRSRESSMSRKVNIAIVGLGFGAEFIPIYRKHPDANMYAICQRTRHKLDEIGDTFEI